LNAYQQVCGGDDGCGGFGGNAFLTKINSAGNALVYSTFLGGEPALNAVTGVAVDSAGEAYVAGYTRSVGAIPFPTTSGALIAGSWINVGTGDQYAFFAKFDAGGDNLLYSTLFGSESMSNQNAVQATGIAIDSSGDAYITGWTQDGNLPTTAGAFQTTTGPLYGGSNPYYILGYRGWVAKFDPTQSGSASLIYATYLGGTTEGVQKFIVPPTATHLYLGFVDVNGQVPGDYSNNVGMMRVKAVLHTPAS